MFHWVVKCARFNAAWEKLAERGECDALGSAEWHRVAGEWINADMPMPPETFIRQHANAPAEPHWERVNPHACPE